MGQIQSHRGPDDYGVFLDDDIGLTAHRLSIIDLEGGHQPMPDEDGSVWVVFNGEIYNFIQLREELLSKGHHFQSRSDTEVIVHAYEEWGEDSLARLNGMFAIGLWDTKARLGILARDRLGIKPLYISQVDGSTLFASELKALLLHTEVSKELDELAIADFLARRFPLGDRTPFKAIRRLRPGHLCRVSQAGVELVPFSKLPSGGSSRFGVSARDLRGALEDSVNRQLMSDVPVGVSLSGGIDSSILAALAEEISKGHVSTFTAGFGERSDEVQAARRVAEFLGTNHHEVTLSFEEMTSKVPTIVWHLDELVADPAVLPTYFVAGFARESVKVVLLGEGSDELFGGYSHYGLGAPPISFLPEAYRRGLYERVNLIFSEEERASLCHSLPSNTVARGFLDDGFTGLPFAEAMMRSEIKNVLPNFQLHRVDRMSMAHGLEARVPYLDNVVMDVALRMERRAKVRPLSRKVLLRRAAGGLLPRQVIRRRKRIFSVPLRSWLSEVFGEALEVLLDSSEYLKRAFREDRVMRLLNRRSWQRSDRGAYKAWMLGMLDLWHRTFVERGPRELHQPIKLPW